MEQLLISTSLSGRDLRKGLNGLLKSGAVEEVKRMQYIKSYRLDEHKNIVKQEEKLLRLFFVPENKEKLMAMLKKLVGEYQELSM